MTTRLPFVRAPVRGPRLWRCAGFSAPLAILAQEPALGSPGQTIYRARCASCHDAEAGSPESTRAPSREALRAKSREDIVTALSAGGLMAPMATGITAVEKAAIAAYLSPIVSPPADPTIGRCLSQAATLPDPSKLPQWNGWGNDPTNARFQSAAAAGLTAKPCPEADAEMGVRHSRRDVPSAPSPPSSPAACSSAARTAPSTRSTPRPAASTGSSRPTPASAARSASGRSPAAGPCATPPTSATSAPTSTRSTR